MSNKPDRSNLQDVESDLLTKTMYSELSVNLINFTSFNISINTWSQINCKSIDQSNILIMSRIRVKGNFAFRNGNGPLVASYPFGKQENNNRLLVNNAAAILMQGNYLRRHGEVDKEFYLL